MGNGNLFVLHIVVSGGVQGVGFRFFTIHRARKYGITGWVKNRYDGRVEIEAEGKKDNLILFLEDIKIGPSAGSVSRITEEWHEIAFLRYKSFSLSY